MDIRCIPDNAFAVAGVLNTKKVRFDIQTTSRADAAKRIPLNLALILDRSGSMESDQKLTFAKRAIVSVLHLLHDDDIVHLIAYDTDITIVFENARAAARQALAPRVNDIQTGGSTNISGAIEAAASLLTKYVHEGYSRRMFLFSDGQANVGMQTRPELTHLVGKYNSEGVMTDSFGIGADFDGEIMKGIADAGGSRFFYLESAQVIESFVTKALLGVFGVCGSQTRLILRGQNGAVVTKMWGHADLIAGASLGDLHSNNLRSVLAEFTVAGSVNPDEKPVVVLDYELRYQRPSDLQGEPVVIRQSLSLTFVQDEARAVEVDPRVKTIYATQAAADMDTRIAKLVGDGQREEAIALVKEQIALLKSVEAYDDERGVIGLLIRMAENLHNKIQDRTTESSVLCQAYGHQSYLKQQNSCAYMEDYA